MTVLHRRTRATKGELATPFVLPIENLDLSKGIDSKWIISAGTPTVGATTGGVTTPGLMTHGAASAGVYLPLGVEKSCRYRIQCRIYVPSGQTWSTRRPGLRLLKDTALSATSHFQEELTVIGDEDSWKLIDITVSSANYRWIGLWFNANATAGNTWYWKIDSITKLDGTVAV